MAKRQSLFIFCLIFYSVIRADDEVLVRVPRRVIDTILSHRADLAFSTIYELKKILRENPKSEAISLKEQFVQNQLGSYSMPKEFSDVILKLLESKDTESKKVGLLLSQSFLRTHEGISDLVKKIVSVAEETDSPDMLERIFAALEYIDKSKSKELTALAIKHYENPKNSESTKYRLGRILTSDTTPELVRFWIEQQRKSKTKGPVEELIKVLEKRKITLGKEESDFLFSVLAKTENLRKSGPVSALVAQFTGSDELKKFLSEQMSIPNRDLFHHELFAEEVAKDEKLKEQFKRLVSNEIRDGRSDEILQFHTFLNVALGERESLKLLKENRSTSSEYAASRIRMLDRKKESKELSEIVSEAWDVLTEKDRRGLLFLASGTYLNEKQREQAVELLLKEECAYPANIFPIRQDGEKLELMLDSAGRERFKPYFAKIKAYGMNCILSKGERGSKSEWVFILGSFDLLNAADKSTIYDSTEKLENEFRREVQLRKLTSISKYPEDKHWLDPLFKKMASDHKSLIGRSKELEEFRDTLSSSSKNAFDERVSRLLAERRKESPKKLAACEMLCGVRANADWSDSKYLKNSEGEEHISEHLFGVRNVIALFDLVSKPLCPEDKISRVDYSSFHRNEVPIALKAASREEEKAKFRDEQERRYLKMMDDKQKLRGVVDTLRSVGIIDKTWAEKAHSGIDEMARKEGRAISTENGSFPGQITNALLYATMIGNLVNLEIEKMPADEKKKWQDWATTVSHSYDSMAREFKTKENGIGGSLFGGYGLALTALSKVNPPKELIQDMQETALAQDHRCTIPYRRGLKSEEGEAVFRSTVFYYALWKNVKTPKERELYKKSLIQCVRSYANNPWGVIHTSDDRKAGSHHVGKREMAPYYYYATMFKVTESLAELTDSKDLKTGEAIEVKALQNELFSQLQDAFDEKAKSFMENGGGIYPNRPAYYNPLMALALVPYCRAERAAPSKK